MSVAVIINPIAGGARASAIGPRAELATAAVTAAGESATVFVTQGPGHGTRLATAAAEAGARLVLAWGGDGTINEVASALAFGPVAFGIVPSGSGNGLARELGVSRDPAQAIAQAIRATPRPMDLGEIEGRLFVNLAGLGLDAEVAAEFNRAGNERRGLAGYVAIAARLLLSYEPQRYVITTPETRLTVRAVLVTTANAPQFGNDARIAPGARVDDGRLDLVIVEERARWRTVCGLPRLFTGSVHKLAGYSVRRIERAVVACERPMTFHVDGEPVQGGTELHVRVHPGALLVAVT